MSAITKILLDRIKHITHSTCYSGSQKEAKITEIKVIMRKVQRSKSLELQQQAEAIVWISVDERLPETLQDVIAINEDKEIYIDFICKDGRWEYSNGYNITHWQPLPNLPITK